MIRKQLQIINRLGLHARAAAKFVNCAGQFASDIRVERNNNEVNGKSIMGMMMLAASQGTSICVKISGEDEEAACTALEALISDRFGEVE